jgi:hypothetical protein
VEKYRTTGETIGDSVMCLVHTAGVETALEGVFDRLVDFRRYCEMEMNVDRTKVMRILWKPFPAHILIDPRKTKECRIFQIF